MLSSLPERYRQWIPFAVPVASFLLLVLIAEAMNPTRSEPSLVRLAMIGNSMQYYNDLPRVLEAMAQGRLKQNSCLHGNADFTSHLWYGNGMYNKWQTGQARLWDLEDAQLYDYGACTPEQLLFGTDSRLLEEGRRRARQRKLEQADNADDVNDDYYNYGGNGDDNFEATFDYDDAIATLSWAYDLEDDGTNPCLQDEYYNEYLQTLYEQNGSPKWDFILLNDNTRNPCCTQQRAESMEMLETVYLPWIKATGATPIFLVTPPYWAPSRDMTGLVDIPTFESYTYQGYLEYAKMAEDYLPSSQKPRIAPVGIAMLLVWEEHPNVWKGLMHSDQIHLSPSGTFLEACIIYATIFGKLPALETFHEGEGPVQLWSRARRMAPPKHEYKPYPTRDTALYLYHVAHRVVNLGDRPQSLVSFANRNSTSANFVPDDENNAEEPNY